MRAPTRLWLMGGTLLLLAASDARGEPPRARFEPVYPALRFVNPVHVASVRDGRHLLVAEVGGRLHMFPARQDVRRTSIVLDLGRRVLQRNFVEGLLGFALHPRWPARRDLFVYYAARPRGSGEAPQTVLSRFHWPRGASRVDARSEQVLLAVENPNTYHHGGSIAFGPDGCLYLSVGDMGPQNDADNVAQKLGSLRGKILRIDVDEAEPPAGYRVPADNPFVGVTGARPEVWAYGFRNPYRISFDPVTGDLWVGDVGQDKEEEVNLVRRGGNYGWSLREGKTRHRQTSGPEARLEEPVLSYGRTVGASITGGHVYRGRRLPELVGAYVYADWVSSRAFFLRYDGARVTEAGEIGRLPNANGLGLNDAGELLAVGMDGRLMQLVPGAPIPAPVAWAMSGSPVEGEPALDETSLRAVAGRAEPVERGRLIFASRGCPACHGARGEGALGPNLRDDHWLHGSRMTDIVRTIARGNPQAGMPAWAEVLSAAELHAVGAFVASLGGGSPMPGKAPQGKRDPISYPVYGRGAERRR